MNQELKRTMTIDFIETADLKANQRAFLYEYMEGIEEGVVFANNIASDLQSEVNVSKIVAEDLEKKCLEYLRDEADISFTTTRHYPTKQESGTEKELRAEIKKLERSVRLLQERLLEETGKGFKVIQGRVEQVRACEI